MTPPSATCRDCGTQVATTLDGCLWLHRAPCGLWCMFAPADAGPVHGKGCRFCATRAARAQLKPITDQCVFPWAPRTWTPSESILCRACGGGGQLWCYDHDGESCMACAGTGEITCSRCDGAGSALLRDRILARQVAAWVPARQQGALCEIALMVGGDVRVSVTEPAVFVTVPEPMFWRAAPVAIRAGLQSWDGDVVGVRTTGLPSLSREDKRSIAREIEAATRAGAT